MRCSPPRRCCEPKGVVGKFVEFYGPGIGSLSLADRATIANMAPEYGATIGFFPIDEETLRYMRLTGRTAQQVALIEAYAKAQGLFQTDKTPDPNFADTMELDLGTVEPSLAGPRRPQDRVPLSKSKQVFRDALPSLDKQAKGIGTVAVKDNGRSYDVSHGSVVIAAITSCTNTSNPSVMIAAGLLAKKAVERGLTVKPWVKTSLAPGSRVVTDYLQEAGLLPYLEKLRFHVVGYGCTTCIGNSGPLPEPVTAAVKEGGLVVAAVLSGNRNFEGRVNPQVRANYLASPPLVVAYAIAGHMDMDLTTEPLGNDSKGQPVYLKDVWPTQKEVQDAIQSTLRAEMFQKAYEESLQGDDRWKALEAPAGELFQWDETSTYVKRPPFFDDMPKDPPPAKDIRGARVLAVLGDSVTTDHISPAGSFAADSPAGRYLIERGVPAKDFNSYGARRGNHEVMMRGTFANIRLTQSDAARNRRRAGAASSGQEADVDLRCGHAVRIRRRAADDSRRKGIWLRFVARLGGQRPAPAGHSRGAGGKLRTHSSQQSRRNGNSSAAVPAGTERRVAGPDGFRDLRHRRHCRGLKPGQQVYDPGAQRRR